MSAQRILIVCPHCLGTNRIDPARIDEHPNCGHCHQPLIPAKAIAVDDSGLRRLRERSELPLLVDYWAPWCGPCLSMAPALERAAASLAPRVQVLKLDTEANQWAAQEEAIRSLPTLVLYGGGRELDRISGALRTPDIVNWVVPRILGQS
jgi:thioredoxin 2